MHPRNRHQGRYNFPDLLKLTSELKPHLFVNKYGDETLDFSKPESVKLLNKAILRRDYGVKYWDIPENYLCPPIPGRADYIHYLADLTKKKSGVKAWDVGVGANCIYPLIGTSEYDWNFVGSEIDEVAFKSALAIVEKNNLQQKIELRFQSDRHFLVKNLIRPGEKFDFILSNPPFHSSAEEAAQGTMRKQKNLGLKPTLLNFGGRHHELWTEGGELAFVSRLIDESAEIRSQCLWFTSLISKKENLPPLRKKLSKLNVPRIRVLEMSQGQKISRILAWSYDEND